MLYGFTKNKNYTEAISYGNKALEILKEYPFPSLQISVDSGMYVAYEAKGDYVNAIKYLKTFYHEKYSMLSEKQREHLNEMQVMFEVKEKDLTIAEQKLALDKKQKRLQLLLFLSALLVLIVAGIIIYNIRNHQFRKKLYKKEKYLDYRVNEVRQWVKGDIIKRSITPLNPEIYAAEENPDNINIDILSPQNILYAELREMIENKKLYLNPELNLQKVIKLLGTNKKYLYEAISSNSDDNFRNFINRYRVDYAKRMIEENVRKKEETNISDLFSFCGFNNATSFFRTFKTITGLTPKEYAAEAKIDYKSEMIT
jgi:AraC-like DNA-binding protein